jgi:hypothetical protein
MTEEEEEKLARLEQRLVANVEFNDQAHHILGFHTEHLGWVQFSNGVSVNTHKGFALEILMTMAPILDEGVPSLSFRLEGVEQMVPYEYIRELLGFQREPQNKWMCLEAHWKFFWNMITGEDHQRRNTIRNPIIQVFHSWMCKRILGRMREQR